MTPKAIGEKWLQDVKDFQKQLPAFFKGFASYPDSAKQALTDIAYQYGPSGASKNAANGAIKTAAESGSWDDAASACDKLAAAGPTRNARRAALFKAAAASAPKAAPKAAPKSD